MRINKFLATCGVASRRNSELLITDGKVKVNGHIVTNLATDIDVDNDNVVVNGDRVQLINNHIYLMLNKPKGYICSTDDEKGRKTVLDLLGGKYRDKRIFPIGRLDYDTEGLLLLTTDGDLANKLMHPRNEITKTYIAKIEGEISEESLNTIRNGVMLDGTRTNKSRVRVLEFTQNISRIEIVISEGRNRQVRRMFESINREVIFLKRVAIGELRLGGLSRGDFRELKENEIESLKSI